MTNPVDGKPPDKPIVQDPLHNSCTINESAKQRVARMRKTSQTLTPEQIKAMMEIQKKKEEKK